MTSHPSRRLHGLFQHPCVRRWADRQWLIASLTTLCPIRRRPSRFRRSRRHQWRLLRRCLMPHPHRHLLLQRRRQWPQGHPFPERLPQLDPVHLHVPRFPPETYPFTAPARYCPDPGSRYRRVCLLNQERLMYERPAQVLPLLRHRAPPVLECQPRRPASPFLPERCRSSAVNPVRRKLRSPRLRHRNNSSVRTSPASRPLVQSCRLVRIW